MDYPLVPEVLLLHRQCRNRLRSSRLRLAITRVVRPGLGPVRIRSDALTYVWTRLDVFGCFWKKLEFIDTNQCGLFVFCIFGKSSFHAIPLYFREWRLP